VSVGSRAPSSAPSPAASPAPSPGATSGVGLPGEGRDPDQRRGL